MATMVADAVFLDTSVLLSAVTPSRRLHEASIRALDGDLGTAYVSGQVLREFMVVSTRPLDLNGLGQDAGTAIKNVEVILARTRFLSEGVEVAARLRALIEQGSCTGKQIQDANIVATMLVHGVPNLLTANLAHFQRFAGSISVQDLAAVRVEAS